MKYIIAAMIVIVGMSAAYAGGFMMLHVGSSDGGSVLLTNLRIINTGDFRITNTAANRAVSP
jgi:hypothetical protein